MAALGCLPLTCALLAASIHNSLVRFTTTCNTNGKYHENKQLSCDYFVGFIICVYIQSIHRTND
jgi:hypothetical protein